MKTIMVVDDEINILEEVKKCLEEDDFQVITADNNRKALELMQNENEEDLGLILIDTKIPNTDKSALFSMKPGTKRDIDTTKKEDFLQKPFTKAQLIDFIKNKMKTD